MEPKHPILVLTMNEIIRRLLDLKDIQRPRIVHTTGPDAMSRAYGEFLDFEPKDRIYEKTGIYRGGKTYGMNKTVHKVKIGMKYVKSYYGGEKGDIVPYHDHNGTFVKNVTRHE